MCQSESPFPGSLGSAATPGYPVGGYARGKANAKQAAYDNVKVVTSAKDPMGGYTFEQGLRRRRAALQERQARIGQKIQLLTELLRVFEED